jgi:hypothetical protein
VIYEVAELQKSKIDVPCSELKLIGFLGVFLLTLIKCLLKGLFIFFPKLMAYYCNLLKFVTNMTVALPLMPSQLPYI